MQQYSTHVTALQALQMQLGAAGLGASPAGFAAPQQQMQLQHIHPHGPTSLSSSAAAAAGGLGAAAAAAAAAAGGGGAAAAAADQGVSAHDPAQQLLQQQLNQQQASQQQVVGQLLQPQVGQLLQQG
jgi:hypothetical protein